MSLLLRHRQLQGPASCSVAISVGTRAVPDRFAAWDRTLARLTPEKRREFMRIVRKLALCLRRTDPSSFVPDPQQFPARGPAQPPFIFSELQILALLEKAAQLPATANSPLRATVYRLAVVLLYTAGLRRGHWSGCGSATTTGPSTRCSFALRDSTNPASSLSPPTPCANWSAIWASGSVSTRSPAPRCR